MSKKTVLNWIYKDALKAFTTYGGHYRVWPGDLKKFLVKAGMDVPFQYVDDRQITFLIVDDDPAYKMLLKEAILLRFQEADVITTDDGYEALLLIGERKPNFVMLDLRMPKVDGYQVLELLRSRNKDNLMKVVVLSAYIDDEAQDRLSHSVADVIWEKRKDISELLESLQEMMESPKTSKTSSLSHQHRLSMRNTITHAV